MRMLAALRSSTQTAAAPTTGAHDLDHSGPLLATVRRWKEPRHREGALIKAIRDHLSAPDPPLIDAVNDKGRSALFYLVKARHNQAARFLVESGSADPLLKDAKGVSPLALACMGVAGEEGVGTIALVDFILGHLKTVSNRGADVHSVLNGCVQDDARVESVVFKALKALKPKGRGGLGLLRVALAHGADPNAAAPNGLTPLHAAILGDSTAAINMLLNHGARVDAPKADGVTPLQFAILRGSPSIVGLLLLRGADPSVRFGTPTMHDLPYWEGKDAAELAFIEDSKLMADAIREYNALWRPIQAPPVDLEASL